MSAASGDASPRSQNDAHPTEHELPILVSLPRSEPLVLLGYLGAHTLYRLACDSMLASRMRSAISWQYLARIGKEPYFIQHTSLLLPHSTAMSVAVTAMSPPSTHVCTAESRNIAGVP